MSRRGLLPVFLQDVLGHGSLQSTDVYLASLGEEDVLDEFLRQPGAGPATRIDVVAS